jgi:hypothetical protein
MSNESREFTTEEVRAAFLNHIWNLITYWDNHDLPPREKLSGLMHSILSSIDGGFGDFPTFFLCAMGHDAHIEDAKEDGRNWCPDPGPLPAVYDIAGDLHEMLGDFDPKKSLSEFAVYRRALEEMARDAASVSSALGTDAGIPFDERVRHLKELALERARKALKEERKPRR